MNKRLHVEGVTVEEVLRAAMGVPPPASVKPKRKKKAVTKTAKKKHR